MKIRNNISRFAEYASPAFFASRLTFPAYKAQFRKIVIFSGLASLLEALALSLIYFLILIFTAKSSKPPTDISLVNDFLSSPLAITLACGVLLALAVRLKRLTFERINAVSHQSGQYAGEVALIEAKRILDQSRSNESAPEDVKPMVLLMTRDIPFACGFAARGAASIVIRLIQVVILGSVLFYLSPLLTIFVMSVSVAVITYLSISFENVLESNLDRRENNPRYRTEVDDLTAGFTGAPHEAGFSAQVEAAMATGQTSQQLAARLAERHERQTGSLVIEYIYPIAIIAISLMYTYLGDLAPDITEVALYFLLIRQVIVAVYAVGKVFMSLSKHHQPLSAFQELMGSGILPPRDS